IIAYFALSFILNIVVSIGLILLIVIGFGSLTAFNILLVLLTLLTAGSCVVCYLLTVRIFRNRLNLQ
ncbi:MAG: hypothetical protein IJY04_02670, partial [Clostridia bacterium]|nr:hypothetical protein [Clostridia bacterium]